MKLFVGLTPSAARQFQKQKSKFILAVGAIEIALLNEISKSHLAGRCQISPGNFPFIKGGVFLNFKNLL